MSEKVINLEVLPEDAQRELIDFYEYLVKKYGKRESFNKKIEFFEFVKNHRVSLPKSYQFNREEVYER